MAETRNFKDHYLFGNLESSALNQSKVREVNFGYDQNGGSYPHHPRYCAQLGAQKLHLAS